MALFVPPQQDLRAPFHPTAGQRWIVAGYAAAAAAMMVAVLVIRFDGSAWWWLAVPIIAVCAASLLGEIRPTVLWGKEAR